MNKRVSERRRKPRAKAANKNGRWSVYLLMAMFVFILATGFFFAARQHFSSIDYGIKNSRLRKQLDDLETEKRRLLLAREVSLSPAEIKKAARKLGLAESGTDGVQLASSVKADKPVTAATLASAKAEVEKAPSYSVVAASFSAVAAKPAKTENAEKPALAERLRQVAKAAVAAR